jgi:hypothetical protein
MGGRLSTEQAETAATSAVIRRLYYETSGAVDMKQLEFEEMKWSKID